MKTILLADDSITIQKVVELTFSDGDYRVFCVSNGAQALRKVPEVRPDIVLLDVMMPEKNGYEVCEALKSDPATASIPVVLLTGTFEPFDRRRAEAAGARAHVTKPFESHTLVARVEEILAQPAVGQAAPAAAPASVEAAEPATTPRPAAPTARPAVAAQPATPEARPAPPGMPMPVDEPEAGPHPVFAAPDAAAGGAYMGFADLAVGEGDEEIVPDRYEGVASPSSESTSGDASPSLEGFVAGYDMPTGAPAPAPFPQREREEALGTPPPAPGTPDTAFAARGARAGEGAAEPRGDLSEAALDRLAEIVVRKMSERVVREIAWEIIPGVAETVVRQRIKEIEDQEH